MRERISDHVMDEVLRLIAEGKSLRAIAKMDGMPSTVTVFKRTRSDPDYGARYYAACEERGWGLAEEALEMSDGLHRDDGRDETGAINRDKLGVDTRKWFAACLNANLGTRTTLAGDKDNPLIPPAADPDDLARRIAFLLAQAAGPAESK